MRAVFLGLAFLLALATPAPATSRTDGIRCHNSRGHGFLLGRTRYLLF
jgi:hypothetical protein